MRYFNHDTLASSDELLLQLRLEHGLEAVAVYWAILEYIYGEEKPLPFGENQRETKTVLYRLGLGFEVVKNYLDFMVEIGLLLSRKYRDANYYLIYSLRAEEAIEAYQTRAESARQNGKKGGRPKKPKQNPEKTQSVSSSVSEKNQSENLIKNKSSNTYTGITTTESGGAFKNDTPALSEFEKQAIANIEEQRQRQKDLEAQAIPCPIDYKAIFDEVDKVVADV